MTVAASRGVTVTLQDAATTGNGTVIAIPSSFAQHVVSIIGSADVSAGKVKIETADEADYEGDWDIVGSEVTVLDDGTEVITFEGMYKFLRARVSTTVEGGTVTVTYMGSPSGGDVDSDSGTFGYLSRTGTELSPANAGDTLSFDVFGSVAAASRIRTSGDTPSSLVNGDWWVECTGESPSRKCAIKVKDGDETRTIAEMTY